MDHTQNLLLFMKKDSIKPNLNYFTHEITNTFIVKTFCRLYFKKKKKMNNHKTLCIYSQKSRQHKWTFYFGNFCLILLFYHAICFQLICFLTFVSFNPMDSIYLILFVIKSELFVWIGIDKIDLKLNSGIKSQNVNWRQWGDLTNLLLNHTDMKVTHAWKLDEKKKQTIPCSYHFVNQPFSLSFRLIYIHFFFIIN